MRLICAGCFQNYLEKRLKDKAEAGTIFSQKKAIFNLKRANMENLEQHDLYNRCVSAFSFQTHDPHRRAHEWLSQYVANLHKVESTKPELVDRYHAISMGWLSAITRVASPHVTGPANFPVARMEKLRRYEAAHADRYYAFMRSLDKPAKEPKKDLDSLIEEAQQELDAAIKHHAEIKATPPVQRRHGMALQYASRKVADAESKLAGLKQRKESEISEVAIGHVLFIINPELARYQFKWPENQRPDKATIEVLKKAAFKWAPSQMSWQRQITINGEIACKSVIRYLEAQTKLEI